MPAIWIECPRTNRRFSTGIVTDAASFEVIRNVTARSFCPHCGREHEWRKSDAWLAEEADQIERHAA
jgi:hypothetical protein